MAVRSSISSWSMGARGLIVIAFPGDVVEMLWLSALEQFEFRQAIGLSGRAGRLGAWRLLLARYSSVSASICTGVSARSAPASPKRCGSRPKTSLRSAEAVAARSMRCRITSGYPVARYFGNLYRQVGVVLGHHGKQRPIILADVVVVFLQPLDRIHDGPASDTCASIGPASNH